MGPRWGHTRDGQPVHARTLDHLPRGNRYQRFNARAAVIITSGVGTMTCAWAFALFDALALPTAIRGGLYGVVQWVASFFLQLVLLSIIMVGQAAQGAASDARAAKTFEFAEDSDSKIATALDLLDTTTAGGLSDVLKAIEDLKSAGYTPDS